jgi:hypothetical protein
VFDARGRLPIFSDKGSTEAAFGTRLKLSAWVLTARAMTDKGNKLKARACPTP